MKLYIISNRLPVKAAGSNGTFVFSRSEGGLATGLDSLQTSYEKHWIGWPGVCTDNEKDRQEMNEKLQEMNFHPVFLSEKQIQNYYEGYSNSTLWPLCHYFYAYTLYKKCFWHSYQQVNQLFCDEICRLIRPGDKVWIQDYQLMLLPGMLRKIYPELCIGYFHHIPFPSYELFRILPERAEILKGLLGADFIAFHTHDYMRHFVSTVERVLHLDFNLDELQSGNRVVRVDALPMGINYELYHKASENEKVHQAIDRTRKLFGKHKLVLSVDRLDYSKGILHRLHGFSTFLERHPEYYGKVTLAMVIVPSRDHVGSYAELKTKIDEEIGSINGHYSTMDWTPVCYFYHGFSLEELTAMYYVADIALITPLRDGMNLVAKEYVAAKCDHPGVLILSEMAGAAVELTDAIQINPNDTEQIEHAICQALEMPEEDQRARLQRMQAILSVQTVNKWATDFINGLNTTCIQNDTLRKKRIVPTTIAQIKLKYNQAKQRLILLDYDGTLTALKPRPEDAKPTPELISILQQLASDPANHIVINSGRDHFILEKWFGLLPVSMAAEHGAFYKENGVWHKKIKKTEDGKIDYSDDFFGKQTSLTVSGQLEGELGATALGAIYTFGPTFRAENSNTPRHLAEFWMVEPEVAFLDMDGLMELEEDFIKYCIRWALEHCKDDLAFLNKMIDKGLIARLEGVLNSDFVHLPYTEGIRILQEAIANGKKFEFPCEWGDDLASEHERFLVEEHFKRPVIMTNYPKAIKAFYMKIDEEESGFGGKSGQTVQGTDVLFPQIGEIIGGSVREESYDKLMGEIEARNIPMKDMNWYLDTRKYGSCPHAGFGLGFERLILFVTGMQNIRDVIPFPRTPKNAEF